MRAKQSKVVVCNQDFYKLRSIKTERTIYYEIRSKIADLRKKNNLSQESLAEKMNVSRQAVSKWESEQSIPDIEKNS